MFAGEYLCQEYDIKEKLQRDNCECIYRERTESLRSWTNRHTIVQDKFVRKSLKFMELTRAPEDVQVHQTTNCGCNRILWLTCNRYRKLNCRRSAFDNNSIYSITLGMAQFVWYFITYVIRIV